MSAIEELQECNRVYLLAAPPPRVVHEDGSVGEWAPGTDDIYAAMEACSMNSICASQDPDEYHDAMLVVMSQNFNKSTFVMKAIARARKMKVPLFTFNPDTLAIRRAK